MDERYTRIIRRNLLTVFDRLITITGFTGVRASLDHGVRTLVRNCIVKVLQSDSRRPCGYVARSSGLPRRHARPVEIVKVVQPPGSSFENHLHLLCTYLPLPIRAHFFVELSSYTFPNNPTQLFLLPPISHLYSPLYLPPFLSNHPRDRYRFFSIRVAQQSASKQDLSKFWLSGLCQIRISSFAFPTMGGGGQAFLR